MKYRYAALRILFLFGVLGAATARPARAQDVVAVLSSDSSYYRQALEGFQRTFGEPVSSVVLPRGGVHVSGREKLIVTFGGKAQIDAVRDSIPSVSCLALGARPSRDHRRAPHVLIELAPSAGVLLDRLKTIQPSLNRIAIFWSSPSMRPYTEHLQEAAAARGMHLISVELTDPSLLPDRLRSMKGNADAILLPPDPTLVNKQNFTTMRDFSSDNRVPFYVPTKDLVQLGGTASVSASLDEIGATAAGVARRLLDGRDVDDVVYPDLVDVTVNMSMVKAIGLAVPPRAYQKVSKVIP